MREAAIEFQPEILAMIREWLVERMRGFSMEDLVTAIDKKLDLWANSPENYKNFGFNIIQKIPDVFEEYRSQIDAPLVLEWLKEDEPDKYWVITNYPHGDGIAWLQGEIDNILDGVAGAIPNRPQPEDIDDLK